MMHARSMHVVLCTELICSVVLELLVCTEGVSLRVYVLLLIMALSVIVSRKGRMGGIVCLLDEVN